MYTTIIHPIRQALCLSLNEYCVLDTIYHLSNNRKYNGWCVASKGYIAKTLSLGESTVFGILKTLEEKGLIERNERGDVRTLDAWNELIANKNDYIIGFQGKDSQFLSGKRLDKAKNKFDSTEGRGTIQNVEGGIQNLEGDPLESRDNNNKYNNNNNNRGVDKISNRLEKWFSGMTDVSYPKKLADKYLKLYSEEIISRALNNSCCTSRSKFVEICEHYKKQLK